MNNVIQNWIPTIFFLVMAVFTVPAGQISGKFGVKKSLLVGIIIYLIGSIGGKCFVKDRDGNGYKNQRVLMRINNSFSANFPVIANNAEFRVYCLSNDLSSIDFELVDARFRKVKLLCPMYICGTIIGDTAAETIWTGMIPPQILKSDEQAVADFEQK